MAQYNKLTVSLLLLRMSVCLVIFMWTIDKFINPGHAAKIFEKFYYIPGLDHLMVIIIGIVEIIILAMFFIGIKKTLTYGAILIFHAVSTLSSFNQYLSPFEGPHLLFFAAWPMLAACIMLFLFRKEDRLFQLSPKFA